MCMLAALGKGSFSGTAVLDGAFSITHWLQVMAIKCSFISSRVATKVQNGIKQTCGTLPWLMPQPFENSAGTKRSHVAAGQDYPTKRWRDTQCSLPLLFWHQTFKRFPKASLTCFHLSCVAVFMAGWVSAEGGFVSAGRGAFIHQQDALCNGTSKSKVDKWLITWRNEMIHHFLILSSFNDCLWRCINV